MQNKSCLCKAIRGVALSFLVLGFSSIAFGQRETGTMSGRVTDPTGAIVTSAKITVTNSDTNLTREATTSGAGEYTITNLPSGRYVVSVSAPGFSEFKKSVEMIVGTAIVVDAHLVVGASGTVVEVIGGGAGTEVDTETQTIGATITPSQIMNLPSLTRNVYDFVATAGNVSDGDTSVMRGAGGMAINGQRAASTNILLDGAENVDLFNASVGQQVPLDSVQEFKLSTSNFTADYGRASGGVVNVATKSGTNAFHGALYEYNRVSALASQSYQTDASNYANHVQGLPNLPNSTFVRNQFGYAFGGPIVKDKLFFFSNTEWTRIRSSANNSALVFTPQFIAQTGSASQAYWSSYGTLASGVSNIGAPITAGEIASGNVSGYSLAYSPTFLGLAAANPNLPVWQLVNFAVPTDAGAGVPQNSYNTVNRVDFNLNNKTTLWGRYALDNEIDFTGSNTDSPYAGFNTGQNIRNQNILINLTHMFTPTIVNQAKISYNRLNDLQPLGTHPPSPALYLAAQVPTPNSESVLLPGYIPQTQGLAIPFGGPQNLYQFSDQLSVTKGKHTFSFGGEFLQARDNRTFGAYENGIADLAKNAAGIASSQSPSALDQLLNGQIFSYQIAINPQGVFPCQTDISTGLPINPASCTINLPATAPAFNRNNRFNDGAVYGTDTWKIKPRLTLNLGLRWEYFGVQHNATPNLDSNFYYAGALNPASVRAGLVSSAPTSSLGQLWKSSPRNFGPRIGFAYDVFGNGKTAIRGGYGISYERNFGNVTFNVIQNPPAYAVVALSGGPYPLPTNNLGPFAGSGSTILPPVTLRGVDPNIKTAYVESYSLAVEHEVVRNTVVALEYSGARGIHQYSITNVNRYFGGPTYNGDPNLNPPNLEASRTNNQYGNINFRGSNGDSWYNGVNFRATSSNFQSKGLQFAFNYTWSHAEDELSSTFSETQAGGAQGSLGFLDWQHPRFDKGSSDYDIRNRVSFSAVYTPTYLDHFQSKAMRAVAGGWSIAPIWTWRSGTPFTMYDCGFAFGICARQLNAGGTASYTKIAPVDPIGSPNTFSYFTPLPYTAYEATVNGAVVGGGVADDPSCTNGVCAFPSNMLGRNTYRTPNNYNVNLGVYKTFKLTERMGLQFRAESYNLFNHSNYYLNYGGTDSEFGSPVTVEKGFNPALNGGTFERRNMQFALRLTF
jgi:hypothetical protein